MKEHANIWRDPWGFWPHEAALCFREDVGFDFCGLTWMPEIWMHLINWSLTLNREVKKKKFRCEHITISYVTISNYQTLWVTCSFSYLWCKKQTNRKKSHENKKGETFLFIYLFDIFLFCYICPWESKLSGTLISGTGPQFLSIDLRS